MRTETKSYGLRTPTCSPARWLALGIAVAVAVAAAVTLAPPAEAQLTPQEIRQIRCLDRVPTLVRRAISQVARYRHACVRAKTRGLIALAPAVNCGEDPVELGGPGTGYEPTDRRLAKIVKFKVRTGDNLTKKCDSTNVDRDVDPVDIGLDGLCGGVADWMDVADCAYDLGKQAAEDIFPLIDLNPPSVPLTESEGICQGTLHSRSRNLLRGLNKWRALCFRRDALAGGGVYACDANVTPPGQFVSTGLLDIDRKLEALPENFIIALRAACDQDLVRVGLDGGTPLTPNHSGGDFSTRITVDDVVEGLLDRVTENVHSLMAELFPVTSYCGDGVTDAANGEECDDGNNDSADNCDRDCSNPVCGNGSMTGPASLEECDDGNTSNGDGCDINCDLEVCGNGILNLGWDEDCDDGGASQDCDDDCTSATCGDGEVNTSHLPAGNTVNEQCDDGAGNGNAPDECRDGSGTPLPGTGEPCQLPTCGDGVADTGEDCDEGNNLNPNPGRNGESVTCDLNCTTATCGDGDLNISPFADGRGETCDDGNAADDDSCPSSNSDGDLGGTGHCLTATCGDGFTCSDPFTCTTGPGGLPEDCDDSGNSVTCDSDCTGAACGDGFTNPLQTADHASGEECDDGDLLDGDTVGVTCDSNCRVTNCGNGAVTPATGEACDDGTQTNGDGCDDDTGAASPGNCTVTGCGNGVITAGETCDDAGESPTCDSDCSVAACGDGLVNAQNVTAPATVAGEECDDSGESAACDTNCTLAVCGDSTINTSAGETCDDGGESLTCDANCTAAGCGDGDLNATAGEQCDDSGESATCDTDCTLAACGDGDTNTTAGEACDDAGESAACDIDCSLPVCGDNVLNVTAGEECDDGNTVPSDGCDGSCLVE